MRISYPLRKPFLFFSLAFLMLSLPQCMEEDSTVPSGQGWTSTDPVSIPFRQRMMQAERGNLVKNPSFELGRLINIDSITVSYNITGWKSMGENVTWISGAEVHSGSYSIKIHRDSKDEAINQGDGIVSDFIRVIPGNYEYTFWIRLKDIRPNREREGTRLNDAVDIRMLFYDKNRLLISGNTYNPARQAIIDQSFKALSFAGFWNIDSLGWVSVSGRTTNDFLTEGDIPDEAKFVKLYLGLKGTGTMWVDDVDLRYSRRNFTSLERTGQMFDTTCTMQELLTPRPKHLQALNPFTYHIEGRDTLPLPLVVIPPRPQKQTSAAADLLKQKFDSIFTGHFGKDSLPGIRIISYNPSREIEKGALVFKFSRLGHTDHPGHTEAGQDVGPQGYTIYPDSLYPNLVHLSGGSAIGDYYAAATAVQLLDKDLFIYHQSAITDYPDIQERAFLVSPVAAASNPIDYKPYLSEMTGLKLNWAYLDFYRSRTLWLQESMAYRDGLRAIGREAGTSGMLSLAHMVNPYAFLPLNPVFDSLDKTTRERWIHSGSSSTAKLRQQFRAGLESGASTLVLCTNDYLPLSPEGNYVLYSKRDRDHYINLQAAHLEMILSTYSWIRARNPTVTLEFLPPWYSNDGLDLSRGQAEQYFRDLSSKLPDEIRIMWSGPAKQSPVISAVDYYRYRNFAGKDLVFLNNTMNKVPQILQDTALLKFHPMKLRTLNLFNPFSMHFAEPFELPGGGGKMLVNSPISSEIMKIRMATAADYMWNAGDYDPDKSIWKILVSRFGIPVTSELYRFNDSYFTTLASMIGLKSGGDQQRLLRMIRDQQEDMEESLNRLDVLLGSNPSLLNELKSLKQSLESIFETEIKTVANQIIAGMESM